MPFISQELREKIGTGAYISGFGLTAVGISFFPPAWFGLISFGGLASCSIAGGTMLSATEFIIDKIEDKFERKFSPLNQVLGILTHSVTESILGLYFLALAYHHYQVCSQLDNISCNSPTFFEALIGPALVAHGITRGCGCY